MDNTDVKDLPELLATRAFDMLVLQGDCRYWLPQIPNDSVDLTITDPPYESLERHRAIGTTTRLKDSDASSNTWFETIPNNELYGLFEHLYKVQKNNTHCYVFCDSETEHVIMSGRNPYGTNRTRDTKCNSTNELKWKPIDDIGWRLWPPLTWVKIRNNAIEEEPDLENSPDKLKDKQIRMGMGYHWRRCDERILFFEKGKHKLNDLSLKNVQLGKRAGTGDYPTQKPYNVVSRLLLNSTKRGDLVLDIFAGSGVVGHCAAANYRKAILIDVDTSWIEEQLLPHAHPDAKIHIIRQSVGTVVESQSEPKPEAGTNNDN